MKKLIIGRNAAKNFLFCLGCAILVALPLSVLASSQGSIVINGTTTGSGAVTSTNMALITPNIGAAVGTSLVLTGIMDSTVAVNKTTAAACTLGVASTNCGSLTFSSGYTFNQAAVAGTSVIYTLPPTVQGKQQCVANSGTTGVVNIGKLTVYPPVGSYVIYNGIVNTVGSGGNHGVASAGAAADSACFVAIDQTHWQVFDGKGTWRTN